MGVRRVANVLVLQIQREEEARRESAFERRALCDGDGGGVMGSFCALQKSEERGLRLVDGKRCCG